VCADGARYEATLVYLIRTKGELRIETEVHTLGLFLHDTWLELLEGAGFEVAHLGRRDGFERNTLPGDTIHHSGVAMARSRGGRFLIGCLGVVGAIVVVLIVAGIMFTRWIRTPGPLLEGARLLDERTAVYVEARLRSDDSGARAVLRAILTAQRRPELPEGANVPGPARWIIGSLPRREVTDQEVARALPIELVVSRAETAPGHAGPALITASLPRIGNGMRFVDWLLSRTRSSDQKLSRHAYGRETLFQVGNPERQEAGTVWAAIVGADVLVSRDEATLKAGIDRLETTTAAAAPTTLAAPFRERPADEFLFMGARAGFGEALAEILEWPSPALAAALRPYLKTSGTVSLRASLVSADSLEGTIGIIGGAEEPVAAGASPPASEISLRIAGEPVSLRLTAVPPGPGERKAWKLAMTGLEAVARRGLHSLGSIEPPKRSAQE
jgi:hypothetical protein